jgi:protein TonB
MPASQDLITSLQVTLNEKGEIVKVKILGASGVKELDDAAVESFNEAGPFPNPPKDLLVNGHATIEWGFVVKS